MTRAIFCLHFLFEIYHKQVHKVTKSKGRFPSDTWQISNYTTINWHKHKKYWFIVNLGVIFSINLFRLKTNRLGTLPEKSFFDEIITTSSLSLCLSAFRSIDSRVKVTIKLKSHPIFRDFLPNRQYMYRHFFVYDGLCSSLCALYFAICLVFISPPAV